MTHLSACMMNRHVVCLRRKARLQRKSCRLGFQLAGFGELGRDERSKRCNRGIVKNHRCRQFHVECSVQESAELHCACDRQSKPQCKAGEKSRRSCARWLCLPRESIPASINGSSSSTASLTPSTRCTCWFMVNITAALDTCAPYIVAETRGALLLNGSDTAVW